MNQRDFDDIIAYMTQYAFPALGQESSVRRVAETDVETLDAVVNQLRQNRPDITIGAEVMENNRHVLTFSK